MTRELVGLALVAILAAAGCSTTMAPTDPSPTPNSEPKPAPDAPPVVEPIVEPTPAPTPVPPGPPAPARARYTMIFDSTWTASSHPIDFPENAHFSPLIGGTHGTRVTFWEEGGLASPGIRRMAERGSIQPLDSEINSAIGSGTAEQVLSGSGLGTAAREFEVSQAFPLVTMVTMVAPSPDWFVGVSGFALFQNGQWINEARIDLYGFDAGTDSGTTYTSPDRETIPQQPVARLGYPLTAARPLGTFTFKRVQ